MRRSTSVVTIACTAMLVGACGLVIDPDALVAGLNDTDGAVSLVEGGAADGALADGNGANAPVVPGCQPSGPEVCDDGIDNDCDGRVDCEDRACRSGFECVDAPPEGWSFALLSDDGRPSCPAGFGAPDDVRVLQGDGTFTCACSCGNNCGSTLTLAKGTESTCTVAPVTDTFPVDSSNKCSSKSFNLPSGFANIAIGGGTCSASDQTAKDDPTWGRICAPSSKVGGGCSGQQRCLPKSDSSFAFCVAKTGYAACPGAGFTNRRRTGSTVDDQRACTGCACDANPCQAELDLWTHPNCQGAPAAAISTVCSANASVSNLKAYKASVTNGCTQAVPSTPQGAILFANEQTVCCR